MSLPTGEQLQQHLGVSPFAAQTVLAKLSRGGSLPHVFEWMAQLAQDHYRALPLHPLQRGCPEVIPSLAAAPVWYAEGAWQTGAAPSEWLEALVRLLASAFADIRAEVLSLRGKHAFQQYRSPTWADPAASTDASAVGAVATDTGSWNVLYLQLHNAESVCARNQEICPRTMAVLREAEPHRLYGHTFVSALAPGSHITAHVGSTNKKLRIHLPLVVPTDGDCTLTVGRKSITLREGEPFIFDDSFVHEAVNTGSSPRITLILDVWHPQLTPEEVKVLEFLRNAALRQAKLASDSGRVPPHADFYAVLQDAADRGAADDAVFGAAASGAAVPPPPPVRDD